MAVLSIFCCHDSQDAKKSVEEETILWRPKKRKILPGATPRI